MLCFRRMELGLRLTPEFLATFVANETARLLAGLERRPLFCFGLFWFGCFDFVKRLVLIFFKPLESSLD